MMADGPVRYLSKQWLGAADRGLSTLTPISDTVSVGFQVRSGPDGDVAYHLVLGPDRVGAGAGPGDADVTMSLDWEVALEIAQGRRSAQRAFLDGEVQLGGDTSALLGHQQELAAIDDRLRELRSMTIYHW